MKYEVQEKKECMRYRFFSNLGKKGGALSLALVLVLSVVLSCLPGQADGEYGELAYQYMDYLSKHYVERISTTDVNREARAWLVSEVTNMGYEVTLEDFSGPGIWGWDVVGQNIIFTQPGRSSREIVICAHYDSAWSAGADDNGSGVGVLLEVASRVRSMALPYTVRFILFDGEEPGCIGSTWHVQHASEAYLKNILLMINIDTIAAGDYMMAYSGGYDVDANTFYNMWPYYSIMELASNMAIDLRSHPEVNANYPTPTKSSGSDNGPFHDAGVPYLYFEASNWMGGDYTNFYQTSSELVENGKIMHEAAYDNMDFLMEHFGDRVQQHLQDYVKLTLAALQRLEIPEDVLDVEIPTEPTEEPTSEETESSVEESTAESTEESTETGTEESTQESVEESGSEESSSDEETASASAEDVTLPEESSEDVPETSGSSTEASPEESEHATAAPGTSDSSEQGGFLKNFPLGLVICILLLVVVAFFIVMMGMAYINEQRAEKRRKNRSNRRR